MVCLKAPRFRNNDSSSSRYPCLHAKGRHASKMPLAPLEGCQRLVPLRLLQPMAQPTPVLKDEVQILLLPQHVPKPPALAGLPPQLPNILPHPLPPYGPLNRQAARHFEDRLDKYLL